ncbi:MAG: hypothetical protein JSS49_22490 [Planctomycetes bacterium]|nr:hypothetical protein [Planctomycetota bacterium]
MKLRHVFALAALCLVQSHAFGQQPRKLDLFSPPKAVQLFDACNRPAVGLFEPYAKPAELTSATDESRDRRPAPPAADTRPVIVAWSPPWCGVCNVMHDRVGTGDLRTRVRWIKGDSTAFPVAVQEYAAVHGWPVLQFQPVDAGGSWVFAPHARTLDDLHALTKLRRLDPLPESSFATLIARE